MNTTLIALALSACLWTMSAAAAPEPDLVSEDVQVKPAQAPGSSEVSGLQDLLSGWQLGAVASHGRYSEKGIMQVQGPRSGLSAIRHLPFQKNWHITAQGQLHLSAMHYSSPISGELANVPDLETDLRITALHPLNHLLVPPPNDGATDAPVAWQWAAYAGLAHRLHYNDLRGSTSVNHVGYRRLNHRIYLPIGLQVSQAGASAFTARLEITPAVYGSHTTYMTDVDAERDATATQKSRGWAVQIGWQPQPGWRVSAHHRRWSTSATDAWASTRFGMTRLYSEPASQWRDTGVQISRQF
jgi:hypothetical protein